METRGNVKYSSCVAFQWVLKGAAATLPKVSAYQVSRAKRDEPIEAVSGGRPANEAQNVR